MGGDKLLLRSPSDVPSNRVESPADKDMDTVAPSSSSHSTSPLEEGVVEWWLSSPIGVVGQQKEKKHRGVVERFCHDVFHHCEPSAVEDMVVSTRPNRVDIFTG